MMSNRMFVEGLVHLMTIWGGKEGFIGKPKYLETLQVECVAG